jgi:IS605 OrfB family transposase
VVILKNHIQFTFEIETGPKLEGKEAVGVDTGINALASLSTGEQLGTDIKAHIERVKRCKHGSKGQKRASRALRQRIDEVAKEVVQRAPIVVVEDLKGITKGTKLKRRLSKNMRCSIGRWNVSYWLERLKFACEWNRVSFRSVSPYYTSQKCSSCGHTDRRNRVGEVLKCLGCGHTNNADVNAAMNILDRFLTGKYGSGCKPLKSSDTLFDLNEGTVGAYN